MRPDYTSIDFFASKILRNFDFGLWCGTRILAPGWWRWGAYRIFGFFYLVRIFAEARGTWVFVARVGSRNLAFNWRLETSAVVCFQLFTVNSNNLAVD